MFSNEDMDLKRRGSPTTLSPPAKQSKLDHSMAQIDKQKNNKVMPIFNFSQPYFSDSIYNFISEYIFANMNFVKDFIKSHSQLEDNEINDAANALLAESTTVMNNAFLKFDNYLETKIFYVPKVVLDHLEAGILKSRTICKLLYCYYFVHCR